MYKKIAIGVIVSGFFASIAHASLFERADDTSGESSTERFGLLHHHSDSSAARQAAKAVACASIGKGICLGVEGAKYVAKEMTESKTTESDLKTKITNVKASASAPKIH